MITHTHYVSIIVTMSAVSLFGLYSVRFVRTATDFSVGGRKMGALLVGGSLIGAFVGGTSTVGTAQLAYQYGISAVWFTLGGGLACFIMAVFFVQPLRVREVDTVPQFLALTYGDSVRPWVAIYTSVGMFVQIAAQSLAAVPILKSLFPLSGQLAAAVFTLVMITYVLSGGFWGAGLVGVLKTVLIYATLFVGGFLSFKLLGGWQGAGESFPAAPWLSMFPGGLYKELASGFSVILGFISTQTYLQPVFACKDVRSARKGLFLAGAVIPLAGIASALIGMYMRSAYPGLEPGSAMPLFFINHLNPWLGGVALATLLISLILSGASLCLGVGIIIAQDIFIKFKPAGGGEKMLLWSRLMVFFVGISSLVFVLFNMNTLILKWAFLSMTLRGVTVFVPLAGAVLFARRISPAAGFWAIAAAPLAALLWAFLLPRAIDPLYVGIFLSLAVLAAGTVLAETGGRRKKRGGTIGQKSD
ncbi:MAG TPA: sodium:solute symporter family protein [Bacillota bacterium]|nr:sodium:solute symporter family protein [Bacillota bacterium]